MTAPLRVERIHTDTGSHIEPPLDDAWSDLDKLRWHLAAALHDAKLPADAATVEPAVLTVNGIRQWDAYNICYRSVGGRASGSWSSGTFRDTWILINGIDLGFAIAHGGAR